MIKFFNYMYGGQSTVPEDAGKIAQRRPDWDEFVEACFDPTSPMNKKLKNAMLQVLKKTEE